MTRITTKKLSFCDENLLEIYLLCQLIFFINNDDINVCQTLSFKLQNQTLIRYFWTTNGI